MSGGKTPTPPLMSAASAEEANPSISRMDAETANALIKYIKELVVTQKERIIRDDAREEQAQNRERAHMQHEEMIEEVREKREDENARNQFNERRRDEQLKRLKLTNPEYYSGEDDPGKLNGLLQKLNWDFETLGNQGAYGSTIAL